MRLRELDAVTVLRSVFVEDDVLAEGDVAILAHLLIPGEPIAVAVDAGDDIVQAVAVDVIDEHLRGSGREGERMLDPDGIVGQRSRLFPPGVLLDDVNPAIAVDVAGTDAVGVPLVVALWRNGMKLPGRRRV